MQKLEQKNGFKENFLIPPSNKGVLDGLTFSVKDVFNIQGHKTSLGSPLWEETHPEATETAICVQQLLSNGATCLGSTITGELSCGSSGKNHFYDTPLNPKAPHLVTGGSSSGSAVSVADKAVDFSLGTDAGGSIRVPASFCGVLGMRPSQGIISTSGAAILSPSLDTVGVLANSIDVISKVMSVFLGEIKISDDKLGDIFIIEDLVNICDADVSQALNNFSQVCKRIFKKEPIFIRLDDIDKNYNHHDLGVATTFRNILCGEIWNSISSWANDVNLKFGQNTYVDFSFMKNIDKAKISQAFSRREYFFDQINNFLLSNNMFCVPTTPFSATMRTNIKNKVNDFDYERLRPLVSLASIGRLPQINIPVFYPEKAPIGISMIAGFRKDHFLISAVKRIYNSSYELTDNLKGL